MQREPLQPAASRLESFIRRLTAQRDIIDAVCCAIPAEGPIIELGLGNGRTFDHLRARLPGRRIIAFDRDLNAHKASVPPPGCLVLGEIRETAGAHAGLGAALVHADIGTGYAERDALTLQWLPDVIAGLLRDGGIAVSGLPLETPRLVAAEMPGSVPPNRYFLYRLAPVADVRIAQKCHDAGTLC